MRLLLLLPSTTYRAEAFVEAALRLGVDLTVASERDSAFSRQESSGLLTLDFRTPERAARDVVEFAQRHAIHAVFGVDDDTVVLAAVVSDALALPSITVSAAEAARDKHRQRELLRDRGVPVPEFAVYDVSQDAAAIARSVSYPCVLKPLTLSASRGVIRADHPPGFEAAHTRLAAILAAPDVRAKGGPAGKFLVERFISGPELAIEGLLVGGRLHLLAQFDKPDPLEGPFFEETIYVTPSRQPPEVQEALVDCCARAARALGLERGPIHAELRHNEAGPWLIELAARPIGGKCGQVLRFGRDAAISLEELHLAHALDVRRDVPPREPDAAGVMMVPIPRAGVLREVRGVDAARATPHVTDVVITMHPGQRVVPLPEESKYLGFVFARAERPEQVERALREAHGRLRIVIE